MNNKAALLLTTGEEREALDMLRRTVTVLAATFEGSTEALGNWSNTHRQLKTYVTNDLASVRSIASLWSHESTEVASLSSISSNPSFVYNQPFVLMADSNMLDTIAKSGYICETLHAAIKIATVIYNMALAYHRLALSPSYSLKCHRQFTFKATKLYKQSIDLLSTQFFVPSSSWQQFSFHRVDAIMIFLAANNNLGQLYLDELGDTESAKAFFENIRYVMRSYPSFFRSEAPVNMEIDVTSLRRTVFNQQEWAGFQSNLTFIDMVTVSAPAAAA